MSVKQHVPNAITSLNLICGVIGIWFTLARGDCPTALYFMLAAVVFDFCDGLTARLLGAYSEIGKELDSLADVVSFGVLPAAMMLITYNKLGGNPAWLGWSALLIAVFSALRLAKFNTDKRQHENFIGLPTPASALICASLCCVLRSQAWIIPAASVALSYLLVCELPMFSFKFGKDIDADLNTRMKRYAIISISVIWAVVVPVAGLPWQTIITGVLLIYILENALCTVFKV